MRPLTGWQRLGIVLAIVWLISATTFYFGVLLAYGSSALTTTLGFLFAWVVDPVETERIKTTAAEALKPVFSLPRFAVWELGPLLIAWSVVRAITWVRAGFRGRPGPESTP